MAPPPSERNLELKRSEQTLKEELFCVHKRGFEFNTSGEEEPNLDDPEAPDTFTVCRNAVKGGDKRLLRFHPRPLPLPSPPLPARWLRLNPSVSEGIRLLHLRAAAPLMKPRPALFSLYLQDG